MGSKNDLKYLVCSEVDSRRSELIEISHRIHANPETGFQEVKAAAWLTDYLSERGFQVERGVYGMPTAFHATYGSGRPAVALLAEFDALPGLGHGCGHNIIAAIAVGAAVSSIKAVDRLGGSLVVLGPPAEELYGGKAIMVEKGAFSDLDAALIIHPGRRNAAAEKTLACISIDVEFFGKEAHASAYPEQGINALEAMVLSFNAINSLRQHVRRSARIHGIITDGGNAANIVPGHAAGSFLVRAGDQQYLEELKEKVLRCFQAAAQATGTRLKHKWGEQAFACLRSNQILMRLFTENMSSLGREMEPPSPSSGMGSTDMGNVSQVVPAIHPSIAITTPDVTLHSPEFTVAAASDAGDKGIVDGAKAMAMTVVDLLSRQELVQQAWADFSANNETDSP